MDTQVSEEVCYDELFNLSCMFSNTVPFISSDLIVGAFGVNKAVLYRYVFIHILYVIM